MDKIGVQNEKPLFISPCSAQSHSIPLDCLLNGPNIIWLTEERWSSDPSWLGIYPKLLANQRMATYCDYLISTGLISFISYRGSLCLFWQELDGNSVYLWGIPRTMDTQWRHKSKISEILGWCGRRNMLWPYLLIWDWDLIFGLAVRMISSQGIRCPWLKTILNYFTLEHTAFETKHLKVS